MQYVLSVGGPNVVWKCANMFSIWDFDQKAIHVNDDFTAHMHGHMNCGQRSWFGRIDKWCAEWHKASYYLYV